MRRSMVQNPGVKSVGNFSTRFSLPSFVKRVKKLTDSQKDAISRTGFGNLLLIPTQMLSKNLLVELMERWDYEKRAFVLPPAVLADVFHWLYKRKKEKVQYVGGCLIFLQIWCFEHIDIARSHLMNCRSKFPRVCNWESTKSHHRRWFTTKFKELETNQIIWSLELTSDESSSDIIKGLIEEEKRTWPDMNPRSSGDTSSHIDHTVKSGYQLMGHLIVDLEAESESESNRVAYGMQNLSSDEFSLRETVSRSSACHYVGKEKELTGGRSLTSGADVTIVISSDDDWEDDLQKKSQTLEEQIVQLKNKIVYLTRENKILKNQLFSSLKFEEQNKKLKDEIENLQQENQELSVSTNCLVTRLGKLVFDGITNTLDNESIENNL